MSADLIDSNLIIYAAQPEYKELREYVAAEAPAVSVVSKVETLGYRELDTDEQAFLEDFTAAVVLPVSQNVVEEAIRLRQKRRMSLGDALIAGTAVSHGLQVTTHNTDDFDWIDELVECQMSNCEYRMSWIHHSTLGGRRIGRFAPV